jgi:hypothetical protein
MQYSKLKLFIKKYLFQEMSITYIFKNCVVCRKLTHFKDLDKSMCPDCCDYINANNPMLQQEIRYLRDKLVREKKLSDKYIYETDQTPRYYSNCILTFLRNKNKN